MTEDIAADYGMPAGDDGDGTTFYQAIIDGPMEYYDPAKGTWVWVRGLAEGPNVANEYGVNPASVAEYLYHDSASDTAYHTGQVAIHEMVHHVGHPEHDSAYRGCCFWKDYNLLYKSTLPKDGDISYWLTSATEG
ncbi:MAG: hypothetical protein ABIR88_10030, partial [Nitrospiria bacterium]